MSDSKRCAWAEHGSELTRRYHDEEWGVPVHDDRLHYELLVLEGAQAGLSWETVLGKRENYRRALDGFDYEKVARYGRRDAERLLADAGIIRNRRKIESAIGNAQALIRVREEFGTLDEYVWRFVDGAPVVGDVRSANDLPAKTPVSEEMSKELKKRGFNFVGPTICYAYMQAAGLVNDHELGCFARKV